MSHNKKRNTAFLYEMLLREGTRAAINQDLQKIKTIKSILLQHFNQSSILHEELQLYKLFEENTIEENLAERFVTEVQTRYKLLDKKSLFNEQTKLINTINKTLGMDVYDCFVSNYKHLATISQIFNPSTPIKQKLMLEQIIVDKIKIVKEQKENKSLQPIDNLVYKTFSKKFNDRYGDLLREQKELLTKYVNSFHNNGIELKVFLNEEIERLKLQLETAIKKDEISSNTELTNNTNKTLNYLNTFKEVKDISQDMLQKIIKIQQFVHEVNN